MGERRSPGDLRGWRPVSAVHLRVFSQISARWENRYVRQEVTLATVALTPWSRNPIKTLFELEPALHSIWQPDLSAIAAYHTKQWEIDPNESGSVYTAHVNGPLVGVTGWYRQTSTEAGLRWHGVLPEARRNGYSMQMIDLVCQQMPSDIRHVYEVTRNPKSKAAFCQSGFQVVTDPETIQRAVQHAEYDIAMGGWVLRKTIN